MTSREFWIENSAWCQFSKIRWSRIIKWIKGSFFKFRNYFGIIDWMRQFFIIWFFIPYTHMTWCSDMAPLRRFGRWLILNYVHAPQMDLYWSILIRSGFQFIISGSDQDRLLTRQFLGVHTWTFFCLLILKWKRHKEIFSWIFQNEQKLFL